MLNTQKAYTNLFWSIAAVLWFYLILRAIYSPFVFDEATTFLLYVHNNQIFPGQAYWSANNHLLNSVLTWISYSILGAEEWQLRLPNLLAFPIFAFFLYQISLKLKSLSSRALLVLGVFSGHIFIEMFAYSRGYGLSFAALAGILYFLLQEIRQSHVKTRRGLYVCSFLMLASNLTLLPIAILVLFIHFTNALWKGQAQSNLRSIIFWEGMPIAGAIALSYKLKSKGELYYASEGFFKGSISSLNEAFFSTIGFDYTLWFYFIILVLLMIIVYRYDKPRELQVLSLIGLWCFLFYPIANLFFSIPTPLDRAILYWPFLLLLLVSFALDRLKQRESLKIAIAIILFLPFGYQFVKVSSLNRASAFKWNTEQINPHFFESVIKNNTTVGGYYLRQKCWEYLNIKEQDKSSFLQSMEYPDLAQEMILVNFYDSAHFSKQYQSIKLDVESEMTLMRLKHKRKDEIVGVYYPDPISNIEGFTNLATLSLDSIDNTISLFISATLSSSEKPFRGILGVSATDKNGEITFYEEIRLRNLFLNYNEEQKVFLPLTYSNTDDAVEFKVFFWNKENQAFNLKVHEIAIAELKPTSIEYE